MALTDELVSLFVKATNDKQEDKKETIVYGTIVDSGHVRLDGSNTVTPVATTASMTSGSRVTVMIKNHTATVTGNLSSPSVGSEDVKEVMDEMSEFELLMAYRVTTEELVAIDATIESLIAKAAVISNAEIVMADIEKLQADFAQLEYVYADDVEALNAEIENIEATFGKFADISAEELEAINADIDNLKGYTADFTYISAEVLQAVKAEIKQLDVEALKTEDALISFATIDFSNIGEAAIENLFSKSGIIENLVVGEGTITGTLVGVTIRGDLIEGNTIVADKLVIQGEDGLYYKLNTDGVTTSAEQTEYNSLNGSVILAKSITADKVNVTDLVAFDATIGGFNITDNAIFSEVKDSEDNTTRGVYMDKEGQVNFGDSENFVKYFRDEDGEYHLAISAETIMYNVNGVQKSVSDLGIIGEYVKIGTYEGEPCIELGESDSDFKLVITNTRIMFMEGSGVPAYISNQSLFIKKAVIEEELQQGGFVWTVRSNGNMGLVWKGVTS